ncbi:MAG: hypothetical protein R3F30_01190 [Planctomycetota bacterium]
MRTARMARPFVDDPIQYSRSSARPLSRPGLRVSRRGSKLTVNPSPGGSWPPTGTVRGGVGRGQSSATWRATYSQPSSHCIIPPALKSARPFHVPCAVPLSCSSWPSSMPGIVRGHSASLPSIETSPTRFCTGYDGIGNTCSWCGRVAGASWP